MKLNLLLLLLIFNVEVEATTCRSWKPAYDFKKLTGFKNGRPGWIIDHKCSLFCGGKDEILNLQWQVYKDSVAKDKWENTKEGCKKTCTTLNSTPTRQVFNCK